VKSRCCCCALFFRVLDGGFGILEFAAGNEISAGSILLWMLPAFLPLGFWTRDFWNLGIMKLENTYPPVHIYVVVPVLKINLNGSSPTKYIRMIPVPVPYEQEPNSKSGSLKKPVSSSYCLPLVLTSVGRFSHFPRTARSSSSCHFREPSQGFRFSITFL